jgi:hypothetical protein
MSSARHAAERRAWLVEAQHGAFIMLFRFAVFFRRRWPAASHRLPDRPSRSTLDHTAAFGPLLTVMLLVPPMWRHWPAFCNHPLFLWTMAVHGIVSVALCAPYFTTQERTPFHSHFKYSLLHMAYSWLNCVASCTGASTPSSPMLLSRGYLHAVHDIYNVVQASTGVSTTIARYQRR